MRLMFFISSMRYGGAERVVSTLANYLVSVGNEVQITTLAPESDDDYNIDGRVVRVSLGLESSRSSVLARVFNPFRRVRRLRHELRRYRPHATIAMIDASNVLLALAGIGIRGHINIGSERSYPPSTEMKLHWAFLRKHTYGLLDGVVVQSERTVEWLRMNTSVRRCWVIPNPVAMPLERLEPVRDPESTRKRTKRILAVGRYCVEKGFDLLIEAFASRCGHNEDWELVILGEGSERERLEGLVRDRGLQDRVTLAGIAGNVSEWYASSDLFVLSSRSEGFPNVLLEAMAHGLPVIAFDCMTGPRELLESGANGILVPAGNVAELAEAMHMMLSDSSLRNDYARKACHAVSKYSVENVAGQWIEVLKFLNSHRAT